MIRPAPPAFARVAAVSAALTLMCAGGAQADEDNTPLALSISHNITRDSNFSRTPSRQGETINSTGLRVNPDKPYGRQLYQLSAGVSRLRYAHLGDLLNNDSKDASGTIRSEFGSNWIASLKGTATESLNPFQNNGVVNRVSRNIRKYRDGNFALQYGNGGRWALTGTYDANRLSYSDTTYNINDARQESTGLRATYFSNDLLYFGLGVRKVKTVYPNQGNTQQDDHNIDLSSNWQVTGLSNLNVFLTRRQSSFNTTTRGASGYSGEINWQYTPAGLVTYGVALGRSSGADRRQDQLTQRSGGTTFIFGTSDVNNNNTTTSLNLSARMRVTGKVNVGVRQTLNRYGVDAGVSNQSFFGNSSSQSKTHSVYHETALNVDYQAMRTLSLGCDWSTYSQTQDSTRPKYDGRSLGCNANLTLDSF